MGNFNFVRLVIFVCACCGLFPSYVYSEEKITERGATCLGLVNGAYVLWKAELSSFPASVQKLYKRNIDQLVGLSKVYKEKYSDYCTKEMSEEVCSGLVFKDRQDAELYAGYLLGINNSYQTYKADVFNRSEIVRSVSESCAALAKPQSKQSVELHNTRAASYVIGKKWSIGNDSCNKGGGNYMTYDKQNGFVKTVSGRRGKPMEKGSFIYVDYAPMAFDFNYQIKAKDDPVTRYVIQPETIVYMLKQKIEMQGAQSMFVVEDVYTVDAPTYATTGTIKYNVDRNTYVSKLCN